MLIGDKSRFAVQFEVLEHQTHWVFGKFCYWADSLMIGDYDIGASLGVGTSSVEWVASTRGKKYEPALFRAPADLAFASIYNPIYGGPADDLVHIERGEERLALFRATPEGFDVFDGWIAFLVESPRADRLLWRQVRCDGRSAVRECYLEHGEFFDVLDAYVEHISRTTAYGKREQAP